MGFKKIFVRTIRPLSKIHFRTRQTDIAYISVKHYLSPTCMKPLLYASYFAQTDRLSKIEAPFLFQGILFVENKSKLLITI